MNPDTIGCVWTGEFDLNTLLVDGDFFESGKKNLRIQKYPDTCGRGLTKALYSELMAHRVLHGQFVNPKGGNGNNNYANDLKMEHEVRNDKAVLKGMCGNKTLKAVQRSTSCSYMLSKTIKGSCEPTRECI